MNFQRPKRGQTEEDLLKEAEALRSQGFENLSIQKDNIVRMSNAPPKEEKVEEDKLEKPLLSIFEKNVVERHPEPCQRTSIQRKTAFPSVFKVNASGQSQAIGSSKKKRSLFAQAMEKESKPGSSSSAEARRTLDLSHGILNDSRVLSETDKKAIHEENLMKLATMSTEEIQEHIRSLPEDVVTFFKRRREREAAQKKDQCQNSNEPRSVETREREDTKMDASNFNEIELKQYPHMDREEPEKMEWMGELPQIPQNTKIGLSARFDFNGDLILSSDNIPVTAGLYHHGEEQERAGYTIEEMLILARSTNLQQRVVAFNMLAKVVQKFKIGAYDGGIFEENLLSQVLIQIDYRPKFIT
jgi:hypothetical protein